MSDYTTYKSERGIPLVYIEKSNGLYAGIITVENYKKWYSLYLVKGNGSVTKIENDGTIDIGGHVPNPSDVVAYAERYGYDICGQSMDMIMGRYTREMLNEEPDFIGVKHGYAPENAAERGEFAKHFCSAACNPRDLSGGFHYYQNEKLIQQANDMADDYVEHLFELHAQAA